MMCVHPMIPTDSRVFLVEGIFDMLRLQEAGLSAHCLFTCSRTDVVKMIEHFRVFGVTEVNILFDNDKAGREGAAKAARQIEKSYFVNILELPEGVKDPAELTNQQANDLYSRG